MKTECPDCGGTVSTEAASCPHCGYPMKQRPNRVHTSNDSMLTRQRGCADLLIYGGLTVIIMLFLCFRGC